MNSQMFNSKVSIITKSEIRYEGTLFQVNPQQQNLALKDVRSFGTEGRRPGLNLILNYYPQTMRLPLSATPTTWSSSGLRRSKNWRSFSPSSLPLPTRSPKMPNPNPHSNSSNTRPIWLRLSRKSRNPTSLTSNWTRVWFGFRPSNSRTFDFDEMMTKINEIEKAKG